ncbi:MAG: 5-oxoprolinase subunit PxpA [Cellvibrionaceae bacterium]
MKLNCDMGESYGSWVMGLDSEVMQYVDMANIACGFHASDPQTMDKTVKLAIANNVTVGAHPGYPDLLGFGRRNISFSSSEITNMVLYQVGALQAICHGNGTELKYIKPHGALYNTMMSEPEVLSAVMTAVKLFDSTVPLMIMADAKHDQYRKQAEENNISLIFEAFCDRAYTDSGSLSSRSEKGAVLSSVDEIKKQVEELVINHRVKTVSGAYIKVHADTICVHGDNQFALEAVKNIRHFLESI